MSSDAVKILVTGKIPHEALDSLKSNSRFTVEYSPHLAGEALEKALAQADGLIIRTETSITPKIIAAAPKLKVICRAGIGVDHIDIAACSERHVVVMNTPSANRVSTAEHTLGLILSLAKKIPQATASLKRGQWDQEKFVGLEISQKILGIIGLGNIGQRVAVRAQAFGMNVIACDPYLQTSVADKIGVKLMLREEVLKQSDFVTLHIPLNDETKNMVDENFLKAMKTGSFLINASRGKVVKETALISSIKSGHLQGAALDVFEIEPLKGGHPLLQLDEIILTPHVAGKTKESEQAMGIEAARQIRKFFEEGISENVILKN